MLRCITSRSSEAATSYFTEGLTHEGGYYLENEINAKWHGKLAQIIGLEHKTVTKEDFSQLVSNIDPLTGERLTVRHASNRKAGYDYSFNAPKSVSIQLALSGDQSILKAHETAYRRAMEAIEDGIQSQKNSQNKRNYLNTGNLLYAPFTHFYARPVKHKIDNQDVYVSDMQLHTHCFIINATHAQEEGRIKALEEGNIRRVMPFYESLYHSTLAAELIRAGYALQPTSNGFELANIDKALRNKFSNRAKEISDLAKIKGITNARELAELAAKTRNKKSLSLDEKQLKQIWEDRLNFDEKQAIQSAKSYRSSINKSLSAKEVIQLSCDHFFERKSAIPEKLVLSHAMRLSYGSLSVEELTTELNNKVSLIKSELETVSYITDKSIVMAENRMVDFVVKGKGTHRAFNENYEPKASFLNEQQRLAIKTVLQSKDKVLAINGSAGSGKSTILNEIKSALEEVNQSIFAAAPTTMATDVLRQKGFKDASTLASLLQNKEVQEQAKGKTLLIDESSLIGCKSMNALFDVAKANGSRILLVGDIYQHNSIESGDASRILDQRAKIETARINTIVRQKGDYKKAVELLAKGHNSRGFEKLDQMASIHEIADKEERFERITKDYLSSYSQKRTSMIVSPTNKDGEELTKRVRAALKEEKHLVGPDKIFSTLKPLSLTEAEKKIETHYEPERVVRFIKNQKGFKAGSQHEILPNRDQGKILMRCLKSKEVRPLPLESSNHYQVYNQTQTPIAINERIRITTNSKSLEGSKLNNGNEYFVKGYNKRGDLILSNNKTLPKDFKYMTNSYVSTSYKSQGKDVQDLFILQSATPYPATNDRQFYTSASRGRERISIYTDSKEDLKIAVTRTSDRLTANDVVEANQKRQMQRAQQNHYKTLTQTPRLNETNRIPKKHQGPVRSQERN